MLDLLAECKVYAGDVRIGELAEQTGVPASTVRYYERLGLVAPPARTAAGYRDYDDAAAARLRFVARARRIGLSCGQISQLLPVWDGSNCPAAHEEVVRLVDTKRAEIDARIRELEHFAEQLDDVHATLASSPPPAACRTDLSCCMPETSGAGAVPIALTPTAER